MPITIQGTFLILGKRIQLGVWMPSAYRVKTPLWVSPTEQTLLIGYAIFAHL